jgi:hypothetical protein
MSVVFLLLCLCMLVSVHPCCCAVELHGAAAGAAGTGAAVLFVMLFLCLCYNKCFDPGATVCACCCVGAAEALRAYCSGADVKRGAVITCVTHYFLMVILLLLLLLLQDADLSRLAGINMQLLIPALFLGEILATAALWLSCT